jgi:hypothetical protein
MGGEIEEGREVEGINAAVSLTAEMGDETEVAVGEASSCVGGQNRCCCSDQGRLDGDSAMTKVPTFQQIWFCAPLFYFLMLCSLVGRMVCPTCERGGKVPRENVTSQ